MLRQGLLCVMMLFVKLEARAVRMVHDVAQLDKFCTLAFVPSEMLMLLALLNYEFC